LHCVWHFFVCHAVDTDVRIIRIDTSGLRVAGIIGVEVSIIADDLFVTRLTGTTPTDISHHTCIFVFTRPCIVGEDTTALRVAGIISAGVLVVAGDVRTVAGTVRTDVTCSACIPVIASYSVVLVDTSGLRVAGIVGAWVLVVAVLGNVEAIIPRTDVSSALVSVVAVFVVCDILALPVRTGVISARVIVLTVQLVAGLAGAVTTGVIRGADISIVAGFSVICKDTADLRIAGVVSADVAIGADEGFAVLAPNLRIAGLNAVADVPVVALLVRALGHEFAESFDADMILRTVATRTFTSVITALQSFALRDASVDTFSSFRITEVGGEGIIIIAVQLVAGLARIISTYVIRRAGIAVIARLRVGFKNTEPILLVAGVVSAGVVISTVGNANAFHGFVDATLGWFAMIRCVQIIVIAFHGFVDATNIGIT